MIVNIAYVIFWVAVPLLTVFFRIQKKVNTGFAIGIVLTSFLLGLITANSFKESYEDRFVRLLNNNKINEAEIVLMRMLQENPLNIHRINNSDIVNQVIYKRIKSKLAKRYLKIVDSIKSRYHISDSYRCEEIHKARESVSNLDHALRLLLAVDSIGVMKSKGKEDLKRRIERGRRIISITEKNCEYTLLAPASVETW